MMDQRMTAAAPHAAEVTVPRGVRVKSGALTVSHGSYALCAGCRKRFIPRVRRGPNKSRFCSDRCRYDHHNARRKQNPPTVAADAAGKMKQQTSGAHHIARVPIRKGSKLYAIAAALARGEKFDCFAAVRLYHDYVARSTVSELANRYGVEIVRTPKTVAGHNGSTVRCIEYHCDDRARADLARLLGRTTEGDL